uniref:Uncharacterized protein n=1 Tax=Mycena chlorophos TaxID=658473 RepID=A0ABQ0L5V5_MYCCL|nr:predicted protein [Mycena chlorophos]
MALLDPIINRPNRVLELQKKYQADPRPVFLRPAGAKQTLVVYGAIFATGMLSTVYGIGCLVTGYGKAAQKQED